MTLAAPGWYPESGRLRYWDGATWTEHYAPLPPVAAVASSTVIIQQRPMHKTSHGFHLIMTILTGGLWGLFVWIPVGIYNASRN